MWCPSAVAEGGFNYELDRYQWDDLSFGNPEIPYWYRGVQPGIAQEDRRQAYLCDVVWADTVNGIPMLWRLNHEAEGFNVWYTDGSLFWYDDPTHEIPALPSLHGPSAWYRHGFGFDVWAKFEEP